MKYLNEKKNPILKLDEYNYISSYTVPYQTNYYCMLKNRMNYYCILSSYWMNLKLTEFIQ